MVKINKYLIVFLGIKNYSAKYIKKVMVISIKIRKF